MNMFHRLGYSRKLYKIPVMGRLEFYKNSPSHKGSFAHAMDIMVGDPRIEETVIFVPYSGKILELEQSNTVWGTNSSFAGYLNYITIGVGNNEFYELGHIQKGSCFHKKGDCVERGEYLANIGINGWMTETNGVPDFHLHFMVGCWLENRRSFKSVRIRRRS